jgi:hypothetical protein
LTRSQDEARPRLFEERAEGRRLLVLLQGVEEANNVAFSECLAMAREEKTSLWHVGELKPVYRRFFESCFPDIGSMDDVLAQARKAGAERIDVLINPEMIVELAGKKKEKAVLQALHPAAQPAASGDKRRIREGSDVNVTLFWNSRNAAYLLRSLDGSGASKRKADLLLQVGPEPAFHRSTDYRAEDPGETRVIRWGWRADGADLFIPLDRSILLSGYGEPSGRSPRSAGSPSREAVKKLLIG